MGAESSARKFGRNFYCTWVALILSRRGTQIWTNFHTRRRKRFTEKLVPDDREVQQRAGNSGRADEDDPGLQPKTHRCVLTGGTTAQNSFAVFSRPCEFAQK